MDTRGVSPLANIFARSDAEQAHVGFTRKMRTPIRAASGTRGFARGFSKRTAPPCGGAVILVDPRGVEPLSENLLI